jgi:hypothetical protein
MAMKSRHMRSLAVRAQRRLNEARQLCESTICESLKLGQHRWLAHPFYVLALLARDWRHFQVGITTHKKPLAPTWTSGF